MFRPKDRTEEIINLIWNRNEYYLVTAGKDAPTEKEIKRISSSYGVKVPKEFLVHATGYWGSLYLEVKEDLWPRAKAGDVGPFWSFLYGVYVYAYSEKAPDWMQVQVAAEEFRQMGHKVLPVLKVIGDADVYCFDESGKIQRWLHEEDRFDSYHGTFFDLLKYEFLELDDRWKRKKAEQAAAGNDR